MREFRYGLAAIVLAIPALAAVPALAQLPAYVSCNDGAFTMSVGPINPGPAGGDSDPTATITASINDQNGGEGVRDYFITRGFTTSSWPITINPLNPDVGPGKVDYVAYDGTGAKWTFTREDNGVRVVAYSSGKPDDEREGANWKFESCF